MRKMNPEREKAKRRYQHETLDALRKKVMRTDARNINVATNLSMPEVPQVSVTELQNDSGDFVFTWGYSRWGAGDVWGPE